MLNEDLDRISNLLLAGSEIETRAAFERIQAFCRSSITARLARVEEDRGKLHAAHQFGRFGGVRHVSGEPSDPPVTASAPDAENYAAIEAWYAARDDGQGHPALTIEFCGPYPNGKGSIFYYCRIPNARDARGDTRAGALAAAAQWCTSEMIAEQTCAICHGRKRDHEGQDHAFTYSKAAP